MASVEHDDVKNSIEELRHQLDGLYDFIDQVESSREMEQITSQAQRTFAEKIATFNLEIVTLQNNLASVMEPVENAITVMQRELNHLESSPGLAQKPDMTVRAVSSLLQLSLSVAIQFFSAEQLKAFCKRENGYEMDHLRRRWMDWFAELTQYLAQALALAQTLADKDWVGSLSGEYVQALDNLTQQCSRWQVFLSSKTSSLTPAALNTASPDGAETTDPDAPKKRKRRTRRTAD